MVIAGPSNDLYILTAKNFSTKIIAKRLFTAKFKNVATATPTMPKYLIKVRLNNKVSNELKKEMVNSNFSKSNAANTEVITAPIAWNEIPAKIIINTA
jgi:hypothetical protein